MNIAVIGYGGWGRRAVRAVARAFSLTAIVDPFESAQEQARSDWGAWDVEVAGSLSDLERPVDACWVCTPPASHFQTVAEAYTRGLHVLCEKPFVNTEAEALQLAQMSHDSALALMVGHLSLHSAMLENAHAHFRRGCHIEVSRRNETGPSRADLDVLWGLGPHDIAALWALAGLPDEITAEGTEHRTVCELGWLGGTTATVELDWLAFQRERMFVVANIDVAPTWDDKREPLLTEALAFADLCRDSSLRPERREEAVLVTKMLESIAMARNSLVLA